MSPGVDYIEFVQGVGKIYNELLQPGPSQIFNKLLVVLPFKTSEPSNYSMNFKKKYIHSIKYIQVLKYTRSMAQTMATRLWRNCSKISL